MGLQITNSTEKKIVNLKNVLQEDEISFWLFLTTSFRINLLYSYSSEQLKVNERILSIIQIRINSLP